MTREAVRRIYVVIIKLSPRWPARRVLSACVRLWELLWSWTLFSFRKTCRPHIVVITFNGGTFVEFWYSSFVDFLRLSLKGSESRSDVTFLEGRTDNIWIFRRKMLMIRWIFAGVYNFHCLHSDVLKLLRYWFFLDPQCPTDSPTFWSIYYICSFLVRRGGTRGKSAVHPTPNFPNTVVPSAQIRVGIMHVLFRTNHASQIPHIESFLPREGQSTCERFDFERCICTCFYLMVVRHVDIRNFIYGEPGFIRTLKSDLSFFLCRFFRLCLVLRQPISLKGVWAAMDAKL